MDQVEALMSKKTHIRNLSVIAHVDHGKSTLTDSLILRGGIISERGAGTARFMDTREDEQERGITIKSASVSLYFTLPEGCSHPKDAEAGERGFLLNLIDSPGHVDFSSEVSAALRVTDGALVVVDVAEGVCVQTETVIRQGLAERVKPTLVVNKVDKLITGLQQSPEEIYQSCVRVIELANATVALYASKDSVMGDLTFSPEKGNVVFASGYQGWGFSLDTMARVWGEKTSSPAETWKRRMWGDWFYDPSRKKWTSDEFDSDGNRLERGFCKLALDAVYRISKLSADRKNQEVWEMAEKLGIKLSREEKDSLFERELTSTVLKRFIPASDALLEMAIMHLPSPTEAQKYRTDVLYEGPLDDECATAIKSCNPEGPLMIYISKMFPGNDKSFMAFGRIFSGTVRSGQRVHIHGPDYVPGKKGDSYTKAIQRVAVLIGTKAEPLVSAPCGNIIALIGIDKFILKSATITTSESAYNIKMMKFSVSPVVQAAVSPKNPGDLTKLVEGLTRLSKSDPCVQCRISESGEHIVAGAGELHLEICLKDLEEDHAGIALRKSDPVVNYRETVRIHSSPDSLTKSANGHNRFYMTAQPLDENLVLDIESGAVASGDDVKTRANYLSTKYDWSVAEARKIWAFAPDGSGPNILVDSTKGAQYMQEIKDSCCAAFQLAAAEGILCREPIRGCRFDINDVVLHADAIHRGGGQVIPTVKRCIHACILSGSPTLLEPIYSVEIQCPQESLGGVYSVLNKRRGQVVSDEQRIGTPLFCIKAYLPVNESFGFTNDLRANTSGKAFPQCTFDHWKMMDGDYLDPKSRPNQIILGIRKRKSLPDSLPLASHLVDKL